MKGAAIPPAPVCGQGMAVFLLFGERLDRKPPARPYSWGALKIIRRDPAVHGEPGAGCPGGLIGGEVEGEIDDIFGGAETSEGDAIEAQVAGLFADPEGAQQGSLDRAGADGIAANAIASVLDGQGLGKGQQATLAGGI